MPKPKPLEPLVRCQAIPLIARKGWREDTLRASLANTIVTHRGQEMPVCGIHAAAHARWDADAEAKATERWGWPS